jgi:hypothetical protein
MKYIQNEGLAIGAPTSSLVSEIYLQHFDNAKLDDILLQLHIVDYFSYVDEIPLAYKHSLTAVRDVLTCFNNKMPNMKFTLKKEAGNQIFF